MDDKILFLLTAEAILAMLFGLVVWPGRFVAWAIRRLSRLSH